MDGEISGNRFDREIYAASIGSRAVCECTVSDREGFNGGGERG